MGEWEQATKYYEVAKDYHSLVRILCFNGQVERAMQLAEDSGSKAACYHLARRLSMDTADHVSVLWRGASPSFFQDCSFLHIMLLA